MFLNFGDINSDIEDLKDVFNLDIDNYLVHQQKLELILKKYDRLINIDTTAKEIIDNFILVKLLKEQHIKLTSKQVQDNDMFKQNLMYCIDKLKSIDDIIKKINDFGIYINSEIIELLCIDKSLDNLKEIILYNKTVYKKKNMLLVEEIIEDSEEIADETEEVVDVVNENNTCTKKKKKKRVLKQNEEIIFSDSNDVISYIKNKYQLDISDDLYGKSVDDMSFILNALTQRCFDGILDKKDFLNKLIMYSTKYDFDLIFDVLKGNMFTIDDFYMMDDLFNEDYSNNISNIYNMYFNPFYKTKEEKQKVLSLEGKFISRILDNSYIMLSYNMLNVDDNSMLTKKINVEYIDQIIESGSAISLKKNSNVLFDFFKIPTVEGANPKRMHEIIYKTYFSIINSVNSSKLSNEEYDRKIRNILDKKMRERGLPIQHDIIQMISLLLSKNEILFREKDTSLSSRSHIDKVLWMDDAANNVYINYLETKYYKKNRYLPFYKIPTDKSKVGIDNIFISRNKVIRLINEHIINGDEITIDIVLSCIFYNMIITDELLESAKEIMTSELKKIQPYQKNKKSIK